MILPGAMGRVAKTPLPRLGCCLRCVACGLIMDRVGFDLCLSFSPDPDPEPEATWLELTWPLRVG